MRNKKIIIMLISCIILLVTVMIVRYQVSDKTNPADKQLTIAQVAKSIAMLEATKEECELAQNYFEKLSGWYIPYMNQMYQKGYFSEKEIIPAVREANELFTYQKLEMLFENMKITDKELLSYVKNNKPSKCITYEVWSEILLKLANYFSLEDLVSKEKIKVVATKKIMDSLDTWTVITDKGTFEADGFSLDAYVDRQIEAVIKGNEILAIGARTAKEVVYENIYISSVDSGKIHAYIYGALRTFEVEETKETGTNLIGDIEMKNGELKAYYLKSEYVSGKLLKYTDHSIELEGKGTFELAKGVQTYKIYGNVEQKTIYDMVVGYDVHKFAIADGKVCAILIDRNFTAEDIRVVLKTNGFADIYHENAVITSDKEFQIVYGTEKKSFAAGEKLELTPSSEYLKSGTLKITSASVDGKISLESISRGYGIPAYRGTIEVSSTESGLLIINELPLEEYLQAVVPSEMPSSYHAEALKAQAVCARSYAYKQMLSNSYADVGAHVDDSTSFQVYNNSLEQEETSQAVKDTYGQILTYQNEPISAFFYSTSCGSGSDGTIWGGDGYPYLVSKLFTKKGTNVFLNSEQDFKLFIDMEMDTYEKDVAWYRWNVTVPLDKISKSVNEKLYALYQSSPNKVLTMEAGKYVSKEVVSIGNILSIEVKERGNSGIIEELLLYGEQGSVIVKTESFVRNLFDLSGCVLTKKDGSTVDTMSALPSAFFYLKEVKEGDKVTAYQFVGGGYGHGAGMSQNGANALGEQGFVYSDILKYYYKDVQITSVY